MDDGLNAFQRLKNKLGVSHPAEQAMLILKRLESLEKIVKQMLDTGSDADLDLPSVEPLEEPEKRRRGRPKKCV